MGWDGLGWEEGLKGEGKDEKRREESNVVQIEEIN